MKLQTADMAILVIALHASSNKVDILDRGGPVGSITYLFESVLHDGWFIHGKHHLQRADETTQWGHRHAPLIMK